MARVVGYEGKTFNFEDGKTVNGFYLYLAENRNGVTGISCERVFVSDQKLDGYIPALEDEIEVYYNRFGKPQRVLKK